MIDLGLVGVERWEEEFAWLLRFTCGCSFWLADDGTGDWFTCTDPRHLEWAIDV